MLFRLQSISVLSVNTILIISDGDFVKAVCFKNTLSTLFDNNMTFTEEMLTDVFAEELFIEFMKRDDNTYMTSYVARLPDDHP